MKSLYDALNVENPEQPGVALEPAPKLTAKELCREILNSTQYRQSLLQRIIFQELPPAVECRLWDYAYGKPVERVEVKDTSDSLEHLTVEQLEARALFLADLARRIRMND